jgi:hypothetical protein
MRDALRNELVNEGEDRGTRDGGERQWNEMLLIPPCVTAERIQYKGSNDTQQYSQRLDAKS